MTPEEIRQIIRDELNNLIKSDRYIFDRLLQIMDGRNIQLGRGTGTKIGTATDQKVGFFNTTPVDQPDTVADATDATSVILRFNELNARIKEIGIIKSS